MGYPVSTHIDKFPMESLLLTGLEQVLFIATGSRRQVQAYIDLAEILATDAVRIRTYVRQTPTEPYLKWGDVLYPDPTSLDITRPMMYFRDLPVADAIKLTIEQTAGVMRTVKYTRYEERKP